MQVSFINVGYGDSILIECNSNNGKYVMLIDGGKPDEEHYMGFSNRKKTIDYLKEKRIEKINLLVVSHLHEDHVGGLLEVVRQLDVDELWSNFMFPEDLIGKMIKPLPDYCEGASRLINALNIYNEMCCTMINRGKTVKEISGIILGKKITDTLVADILAPNDDMFKWQKNLIGSIYLERDKDIVEDYLKELDGNINNTSIVMRLTYGNKKILLPGDIYNSSWDNILKSSISIESDLLKISHHGRMDSVSIELIKAVDPIYAVVSVSNDRDDNCPDPEAINLLKNFLDKGKKREILFTDAVNMPPYSTSKSVHKAIVFNFEDIIEYKLI